MEENNKGKVPCPYCEEEKKKFVKGKSYCCIYCYDTGLIDWVDAIIKPTWGHSGTSGGFSSSGAWGTSGSSEATMFIKKSGMVGIRGVTNTKGNII